MRWLDSITDLRDMSLSKLRDIGKDRESWCVAVHGAAIVRQDLATEQQQGLPQWLSRKECTCSAGDARDVV